MDRLYNILAHSAEAVLPLTTYFSPKMKEFVEGRNLTFSILQKRIKPEDKVIWFHMASLGEFEQGLPIIELVKELYSGHKIVVSFFSPSGYGNKKDTPVADAVVYLPIDTSENANRFINLVHPELVLFIKYEFWPNFLKELKTRKIRTLLISGSFRKEQIFFKPWGSWMKRSLETFEHFFVQTPESGDLLNSIGFSNVTVSGDTRFDRVSKQLEKDNTLDFVKEFIDQKLCIVAGSIWPEDEDLLEDFINQSPEEVKFILAPHEIKREVIDKFKKRLNKKIILFSEKKGKKLSEANIFIVDTIGLLSRIYSYADIAYVGGAAGKTGLHNILEPATFGVPIVIGSNFENFPEAKQLQQLAGLYSVANKEEVFTIFNKLIINRDFRQKTGMIAGHFVSANTGASRRVEKYLKENNVKMS